MSESKLLDLDYEIKELIYENKLSKASDISDFVMEGQGITELGVDKIRLSLKTIQYILNSFLVYYGKKYCININNNV